MKINNTYDNQFVQQNEKTTFVTDTETANNVLATRPIINEVIKRDAPFGVTYKSKDEAAKAGAAYLMEQFIRQDDQQITAQVEYGFTIKETPSGFEVSPLFKGIADEVFPAEGDLYAHRPDMPDTIVHSHPITYFAFAKIDDQGRRQIGFSGEDVKVFLTQTQPDQQGKQEGYMLEAATGDLYKLSYTGGSNNVPVSGITEQWLDDAYKKGILKIEKIDDALPEINFPAGIRMQNGQVHFPPNAPEPQELEEGKAPIKFK